jgi:hypothetical protein
MAPPPRPPGPTLHPRHNTPPSNHASNFLAFLFVVGVAGVVAFAVLAVTTQDSKNSCPCANPYKQLGYDRLYDITVRRH